MNHLPFIAAAYGITLLVVIGFVVDAWRRTRAAKIRLAALDTRSPR